MKSIILPFTPFLLAASAFAATPVIGIVTASGHFTLQGSQVWGNATLFDGAAVETGAASSELVLRDGVRVQLAADSKVTVFADHLALLRGSGQVSQSKPFEVDAGGLKVRGSGLRVVAGTSEAVEVAALTGTANVLGGKGNLIASIRAGQHMSFAPQANGSVTTAGCLLYKDNRFIIQDATSQTVSELNGDRRTIAPNVGNRVTVTGTLSSANPAVSVATRVINVGAVTPNASGGCLVVASALQASTDVPAQAAGATPAASPANAPAAANTGGGLSSGAKTAIIVGVAGGGAAGAIVALQSGKKSTSP